MKLNVPSTLPLQWMSSSGCSMNPPGTINPRVTNLKTCSVLQIFIFQTTVSTLSLIKKNPSVILRLYFTGPFSYEELAPVIREQGLWWKLTTINGVSPESASPPSSACQTRPKTAQHAPRIPVSQERRAENQWKTGYYKQAAQWRTGQKPVQQQSHRASSQTSWDTAVWSGISK